MDESLLITRCRRQERQAQQALFDAFADAMLLVCIRYLKDRHHAEEMMLNGFLKFFSNIAVFEYRGPGSIEPWLRRIMVNECLMFLRRGKRLVLDEEQAAAVPVDSTPLSELQGRELMLLIQQLPDGYRTVFNLYVVEGYSHREIGTLLGISEGSSRSQLSKARNCLQALLQQKNNSYAS